MKKRFILPAILLVLALGLLAYPLFTPPGQIDLKIQPAGVIMPAAYKVYANPQIMGGRYNLFKAVIKNTGSSEIKNLKVQFRIPKLIDEWTDVPSSSNLLPGQTAVVTCYPNFPQSVTQKNTTSSEKTEIRVVYGAKANPVERDESFNFDMVSVNDIVFSGMADQDKAYVGDYMENCVLYACMVSAEDPIIKHYAASIQQKILCGEAGAGVGTAGTITDKDIEEKVRVMEGVYNATLLSHMVYSETTAGVATYNGATSSTEHIRLPREVVSGNTGLCIELALLHASVYKAAGLDPVIFLVPGHAYPGIKVGGNYIAIESTGIGGEGLGGRASADQAVQRGMEELKTFYAERAKGNQAYQLLDINDLYSQGFKDMELTPDPIQSEQVEKIISGWPVCLISAMTAANTAQQQPAQANTGGGNAEASWRQYTMGNLSFQYPAGWHIYKRPLAQLPQMVDAVISPDKSAQIEVFSFQGVSSPQEGMAYIKSRISQLGEQVEYAEAGSQSDWTRFNGRSVGNGKSVNWMGLFRPVNGGLQGLVLGASGDGNGPVLQKILQTIQ